MKRFIRTRALGALGVAAVLVLAGACSSGSDGDDKSEGEKKDDTTEQTTTSAMSDEAFVGRVDELTAAIDQADGDLCAIVEVGRMEGPEASPSTPAQVESLVRAQVSMLKALAAVAPVDETNGPVLSDYADKLLAAAEDADFSVEFLTSDKYTELSTDAAVNPAIQAYQERAVAECAQPDAAPEGTDGAATDAPSTTVAP